jgi:hypothetical protein
MKRSFAEQANGSASTALDRNDWDAYRHCLAFAAKMDPRWERTPSAWRLRIKRLLGKTLWRWLRTSVSRLRPAKEGQAVNNPVSDWRQGSRFGWWPEAGTQMDT